MAKIALTLMLVASASALQFLKPKHRCGDGRCSYHGQGSNDPGSGQNSGNTGGFGGFGNLLPSAFGGASTPDSSAPSSSVGVGGNFFPTFGGGAQQGEAGIPSQANPAADFTKRLQDPGNWIPANQAANQPAVPQIPSFPKAAAPQIPSFPTVNSQNLGGWSPSIGQTLGLPGSSPLDSSNWAAPKIAQSSIR